MNPRNIRQDAALRYPCETVEQTQHDRFMQTDGDIFTILTIARYGGINGGHPVWHSSVRLLARDRFPRERATWLRRDRRQAEKAVLDLVAGVGRAEVDHIDPPEHDVRYSLHLLRPLTAEEFRRLPRHFRLHVEPL